MNGSELHLTVDGAPVVVPCLSLTLYLEEVDRGAVLDVYKRALAPLGDRLTHYVSESTRRRSRFDARAATRVPTWLTRPRKEKSYYIHIGGRGDGEGVSAASFEL